MNFSSSFLHSTKLLDFTHRNRFWLTGQRLGSGCYREAELAVFTLYAAGDDLSLVQVDTMYNPKPTPVLSMLLERSVL